MLTRDKAEVIHEMLQRKIERLLFDNMEKNRWSSREFNVAINELAGDVSQFYYEVIRALDDPQIRVPGYGETPCATPAEYVTWIEGFRAGRVAAQKNAKPAPAAEEAPRCLHAFASVNPPNEPGYVACYHCGFRPGAEDQHNSNLPVPPSKPERY